MDETAQESVGVLQFSVVLVAACSSSIGQMFDSSEEAQTLGVLKSEILDMLKKETIQPYKKIVLFVVNFSKLERSLNSSKRTRRELFSCAILT